MLRPGVLFLVRLAQRIVGRSLKIRAIMALSESNFFCAALGSREIESCKFLVWVLRGFLIVFFKEFLLEIFYEMRVYLDNLFSIVKLWR